MSLRNYCLLVVTFECLLNGLSIVDVAHLNLCHLKSVSLPPGLEHEERRGPLKVVQEDIDVAHFKHFDCEAFVDSRLGDHYKALTQDSESVVVRVHVVLQPDVNVGNAYLDVSYEPFNELV